MAHNEQLADRIRTALENVQNVEEKKMFSGLTFMVNDKMCISVGPDRIMCRIDPEKHAMLVELNGCRSMTMKGNECIGFVYVDEDVLKTKKQLDYWINLCLEYNPHAKPSKKKGK
jgi:TfoX/Sxy family transcriptional regulator of competence genes